MIKRVHRLFGSLKLRLALASLVLIAGSVGLTVVLVLQAMEARSQRAALDAELSNAERMAAVLSSKLVELQNGMRAAAAALPVDRINETAALHAYLQDQAVLRSLFGSVFIVTRDGRLRVGSDAQGVHDWNIDATDRDYVRRTLRERRPTISGPIVSRISGDALMVLTMPVFDPHGEVVAVLACAARLQSSTLLNDLTRAGLDDHDPVRTIVTDASGRIVSHPDPARLLRDASEDPHFAAALARWKAQGRPIESGGSSARLGADIVGMAGVPDAEWMVFRSAPAEVLLGGPGTGRHEAIWIGAMVAIAGGGVILLATFGLLRPLRQLERRALRLLGDDLADDAGWPRASGELGELARVFRHVLRQRAAMRQSGDELLEQMRAVMANAPVGIAFTRNSRFVLASAQFGRMFGYDAERVPGMPTNILCPSPELHAAFLAEARLTFEAGGTFDTERELVRADGTRFWARLLGAPVRRGDPSAGTIWIFADVTETRRQREALSWSASHDELTGLVNRREFEHRLGRALAERGSDEPAAALFIDLDRFKAVNDGAGHAAGDEMLRNVAAILSGRARAHDTVARVGGDEFAVLLRGCSVRAAERVAADICARVSACRLDWQGRRYAVGASVGVVAIDASFDSVDAVLVAADAACYAAKRGGRGAVRTHLASEPTGSDMHLAAGSDVDTVL